MFNPFKQAQLAQDKAFAQLNADKSIKLIDVRTVEEFREGHIKGSVNLPLDELLDKAAKQLPVKDATIFIVCHSGARASTAVSALKRVGYTHVFNIGGVAAWTYGLVKK
jgi:phage shock protein E